MEWSDLNTERYYAFINDIINSRGQWTPILFEDTYAIYESHHIIPRSFGGKPDYTQHSKKHLNLIWLTPCEHFIIHKILAEDNRNILSLQRAFSAMCQKAECKKQQRQFTPEDYEALRIAYHYINCGDNNVAKRPEVRRKISETRKKTGCAIKEKNPRWGYRLTEEEREKVSIETKKAMEQPEVMIKLIKNSPRIQCVRCTTLNLFFRSINEAVIWYMDTYAKKFCGNRVLKKACLQGTPDKNGLFWEFIDKARYLEVVYNYKED